MTNLNSYITEGSKLWQIVLNKLQCKATLIKTIMITETKMEIVGL